MKKYFRGSLVTVTEISGKHAWVTFQGSDNSRRVLISDLEDVDDDTLLFLTDY